MKWHKTQVQNRERWNSAVFEFLLALSATSSFERLGKRPAKVTDMTQERNISQDGFKATGPAQARQELEREISRLPVDMLDPRRRLEKMVRADIEGKPFSELTKVTYDHDGAQL